MGEGNVFLSTNITSKKETGSDGRVERGIRLVRGATWLKREKGDLHKDPAKVSREESFTRGSHREPPTPRPGRTRVGRLDVDGLTPRQSLRGS